jgi:hypothetical protein
MPDTHSWGARYVIFQSPSINRESDFAQDVRDQYLPLVAAGANYFVKHFWRGGLRIDGGCAGFSG